MEVTMWARKDEATKWHRFRKGEVDSMCGLWTRPVSWAQAHEANQAKHGQRMGAPPPEDPVCTVCAKEAGFRRRTPKRVHMSHGELVERLEAIAAQVEALIDQVKLSGR